MSSADLIALHGEEWSLVLEAQDDGVPIWRHLGARVDPGELPPIDGLRGAASFSLDRAPAMDVYPVPGLGWFGPPALALRDADGKSLAVSFDRCEVEQRSNQLKLKLHDDLSRVSLVLNYRTVKGAGLVIESIVNNGSDEVVSVDHAASAILPVPASMDRVVSWRGRHNAEFVECNEPMPQHGWVRETRRGIPGHGGPCGCYLMAEGAGWHDGIVWAMQLAWSGDACLAIERDDEGFWSCTAAATLQPGDVVLRPGESHATPPLLLAISGNGRNGAMRQMHKILRERVYWPGGEMRPRPVHLNSWEACYFAHDEARIEHLAKSAAQIGVERFVLDDGWFRGRSNDRAGLGDWTPDGEKYPKGLGPMAEKINALGMEFGLWVEPEMVNPDSDLYRAHPDWVLALPDRDRPTARNQLVLDMRREDVRDHLLDCLDRLLSDVPISYLKWDHNRDHAPSGGAAQTHGTYDLLAKLRVAHPEVEIESCAGGGGRIDAGITSYVHRFWTSDNIDALARVPIQRGFLAFMPPEMMGAHVGASPSHATGRSQPLDFRAAIACQGHFGVEMDPEAMDQFEREQLSGWIAFYKQWRAVIHGGETVLGDGSDGILWQAQGTGEEYLLWVVRRDHGGDRQAQPIRLPFAQDRDWEVQLLRHAGQSGVLTPRAAPAITSMRETPQAFTGSWLTNSGLPVPAISAESALIYHMKAKP